MARRVPLAALAVALIALAGCGGGSKKTTSTAAPAAAPPDTQTQAQTTPAQQGGSVKVLASKTTDLKKKPTIPKQPGDPPSTLVKQDLVKGTGATAKSGDVVTVRYVGVRFRDGVQFDATWDKPPPNNQFEFPLGAGQVIQGWDEGVAGMKVGGRRQLTIPPDLGYGPQGQPPLIAPNETLIFVVDLKKVKRQG